MIFYFLQGCWFHLMTLQMIINAEKNRRYVRMFNALHNGHLHFKKILLMIRVLSQPPPVLHYR